MSCSLRNTRCQERRTPPLFIAQDVSQDHFPTFSIFYGVDRLAIDCFLLMFFFFFIRCAGLLCFGYFGVLTCLVIFVLLLRVLADALTKN